MRDRVCTYCDQAGHRAHRCPQRAHLLPWTGGDLTLATVLVALIAGWFHA